MTAALPYNALTSRWVRVTEFPKAKKFGKYSLVLQKCYKRDSDEPHSILVGYIRDHPFLNYLNKLPHAPRAVKAIYRAEVRLKHKMARDGWDIMKDLDLAEGQWERYTK